MSEMSYHRHDVTALVLVEPPPAHGPAAAWFVPRGGGGRCTTAHPDRIR